jgi:hypothetical protein
MMRPWVTSTGEGLSRAVQGWWSAARETIVAIIRFTVVLLAWPERQPAETTAATSMETAAGTPEWKMYPTATVAAK